MILKSKVADFALRVAIGMLLGVLFGWVISEVTYNLTPNKEDAMRPPQRIDLVIPYGTAAQVKEGLYNRSLPGDLELVQGDMLVVKNEDTVAHQLGPLFIPPKTSSVLSLDMANKYMYDCSFQPTQKMGLNVKSRADASIRLQGLLAIGMPTGMMLALYSYLLPIGKKKEQG